MPVLLRDFTEADDPRILQTAADPGTRLWNPFKPADDPVAWRAKIADGVTRTFAITDASDVLLGTIALFDVDHEQGTVELGYRVHPDARGRGVGTAAVRAACAVAFGELGLRRVMLYHAVANPASCRVAERAGFALEGTLREGYVYGDGRAYDEHLHGLLSSDPLSSP
ncbi:GNAT family N-acetyltransferase [Marmoricola endophyticus]|uniref:GNAT family N-acetyltransferase n=1 Tax=Marmoricola endophyticus TaxID=2040280 RepID=UPI001E438F3C|nr:GNAT family N-acetyltransferase [Marmoricola endophyticus]